MRRWAESAFWSHQSRTWDERYADAAIAARVDELAEWLHGALRPSAVVVDLGCGTGAHALALHRRGVTAVGVELAPGMVSMAAAKGCSVVRADVAAGIPLATSSVDGALSVYSLQFLDAASALVELARVVRPRAPIVVE